MLNIIYNGLAWLGEEGIIWVVIGCLILFFWRGLRSDRFRQAAPGLMTSLGILGTFCGIFIALYPLDFSPGKINDSIVALLNGMTTAFVTSLLGIASAIGFRVVASSRMTDGKKAVSPEQREILDRLDAIKQAISGDDNHSVKMQIIQMRNENRLGFEKLDGLTKTIREALVKNLESLVTEIRDIVGKQLAESIQSLIQNIEEALIKQFGRTFIEFNEATQAIKKWQEDHRTQVERLTDAFNLAAARITQIAMECEKIPPTMDQLQEIVTIAHRDVEALNRQVEAFAGMRRQAEESFPLIKKHLDEIGGNLAESAKGFSGLEDTIRSAFQNAREETHRIAQQHFEDVGEISARMRDELKNAQRESASKVTEIVQSAIKQFNKEIDEELNRVARAWGEQMVGIAERVRELIDKIENR